MCFKRNTSTVLAGQEAQRIASPLPLGPTTQAYQTTMTQSGRRVMASGLHEYIDLDQGEVTAGLATFFHANSSARPG
jgi:hypothetical protein